MYPVDFICSANCSGVRDICNQFSDLSCAGFCCQCVSLVVLCGPGALYVEILGEISVHICIGSIFSRRDDKYQCD